MIRVYVAGAYDSNSIIGCLDNMRKGIELSIAVLKAGMAPFCPWLDYQYRLMDGNVSREMYQAQSMAWLEASDAVLVVEGSESSRGTKMEIARAREMGIPVYHDLQQMIHEMGESPSIMRIKRC